jgi:hypothetical protein
MRRIQGISTQNVHFSRTTFLLWTRRYCCLASGAAGQHQGLAMLAKRQLIPSPCSLSCSLQYTAMRTYTERNYEAFGICSAFLQSTLFF